MIQNLSFVSIHDLLTEKADECAIDSIGIIRLLLKSAAAGNDLVYSRCDRFSFESINVKEFTSRC